MFGAIQFRAILFTNSLYFGKVLRYISNLPAFIILNFFQYWIQNHIYLILSNFIYVIADIYLDIPKYAHIITPFIHF